MYKIIRFYYHRQGYKKTIKKGLTLEQAQVHCSDRETSSSSGLPRTKVLGPWFDAYVDLVVKQKASKPSYPIAF